MHRMADRKSSKSKKPKTARWQRIAMMDKEILDVEGAATLLGVSTTTIYNLARKGEIPATRVGREWRFARQNLIQWVANGSAADQLSVALSRGRVAKKKEPLKGGPMGSVKTHEELHGLAGQCPFGGFGETSWPVRISFA